MRHVCATERGPWIGQLPDAPSRPPSDAGATAPDPGGGLDDRETFQLSAEAAEAYEAMFVPALFGHGRPTWSTRPGRARPVRARRGLRHRGGGPDGRRPDGRPGPGRRRRPQRGDARRWPGGSRPTSSGATATRPTCRSRTPPSTPCCASPHCCSSPTGPGAGRDGPRGRSRRHGRRPGLGPPRAQERLRRVRTRFVDTPAPRRGAEALLGPGRPRPAGLAVEAAGLRVRPRTSLGTVVPSATGRSRPRSRPPRWPSGSTGGHRRMLEAAARPCRRRGRRGEDRAADQGPPDHAAKAA